MLTRWCLQGCQGFLNVFRLRCPVRYTFRLATLLAVLACAVEIATAASASTAASGSTAGSSSGSRSSSGSGSGSKGPWCSSSSSSRRLYESEAMPRRLGSGPPWYCEDWEKDFLEAVSAVTMIGMAICFEHLHHHFHHKVEHGFKYGQSMMSEHEKHEKISCAKFEKPILFTMLSRMSGEFMVLGFLAFTIWTTNQRGIFAELAKLTAGDMQLPKSGDDYLHMMEEVHMQLFVAMILYFTMALRTSMQTDKGIMENELNRGIWIDQILKKEDTPEHRKNDSKTLTEFKTCRGVFLDGCVKELHSWQSAENEELQDEFMEICRKLNIMKPKGEVSLEDIHTVCTGRFSFCTYLSFSVMSGTHFFINMGTEVMLSVVGVKLFFCILHRGGHIPLKSIAPFTGSFAFVVISLVYGCVHFFRKKILPHQLKEHSEDKLAAWEQKVIDKLHIISRKMNPETTILIALQVLLFYFCHAWAGYMIDKNFWVKVFSEGDGAYITTAVVYILGCLALGFIVPVVIPDFSAIMSLPPFFSQNNISVVKIVAMQVVDAKMVAARAQMSQEKKEDDASACKPSRGESASDQKRNSATKETKDENTEKDNVPLLSAEAQDAPPAGGADDATEAKESNDKEEPKAKAKKVASKKPAAAKVGKSG